MSTENRETGKDYILNKLKERIKHWETTENRFELASLVGYCDACYEIFKDKEFQDIKKRLLTLMALTIL